MKKLLLISLFSFFLLGIVYGGDGGCASKETLLGYLADLKKNYELTKVSAQADVLELEMARELDNLGELSESQDIIDMLEERVFRYAVTLSELENFINFLENIIGKNYFSDIDTCEILVLKYKVSIKLLQILGNDCYVRLAVKRDILKDLGKL